MRDVPHPRAGEARPAWKLRLLHRRPGGL